MMFEIHLKIFWDKKKVSIGKTSLKKILTTLKKALVHKGPLSNSNFATFEMLCNIKFNNKHYTNIKL